MTRSRSRMLAVVAAVVVAVAAAVAFLVLSGGDEGDGADSHLSLHVADPLLYEHTTASRVTCPDGRGSSPIADADHDRGDITADSGFAEGQLIVLTLQVSAPDGADGEPVAWDLTPSDALDGGITCAFVDDSEPTALESPEGTEATASLADARLEVAGLDTGETVVVELWSTLLADADGDAAVSLGLTAVPPDPDADPLLGDTALAFSTDIARSNRSDDDPTVEVAMASPTVELLGELTSTVTVTNPSDVESLSRVTVEGTVGTNATVVEVTVADETGAATTCTPSGSDYGCELGFLAPDEQVVISLTASAVTEELPEGGIVTPGSGCNNRSPRVCHEATLTYLDSLDVTSRTSQAQTRIVSDGTFTVQVRADEEGLNTGDPADFEIRISLSDPTATADSISVYVNVCDPEPEGEAALQRNSASDDNTLQGDEIWIFVCSTDALRSATAIVNVTGEINDADPVSEQYPVEFGAVDSRIELSVVPVVVGTSWNVENVGSTPLTQVQLLPVGDDCEPRLSRNGNGDDVLDVGEAWEYACDGVDARASVSALDPAGNFINDRIEQTNDLGQG